MKPLKRVYVAGAYSAENVTAVLRNIREGVKLSEKVLATGLAAPFSPWLDWMFELFGNHTVKNYYDYSMAWLECADAILVRREGCEQSTGTHAELARARELNIPIFFDDEWGDFIKWLAS